MKNRGHTLGKLWGRDWIARRFSGGSATWTRADVRQMFDDIFGDVMVESKAGFLARVYHSTVRWVGGVVHDVADNRRALLPAAAACLLLAGCSGCQSVRDVADWFEGLPAPVELEPDGSPEAPQQPPATPPETPPAASDAIPYASLAWSISRDRPVGSAPAVVARIRAGKLTSGGLSFSWEDAAAAGKALGSSSHDPAQLRAYVFFGGEGGFFDWCSVTRSSRDFKNVQHEFGWDKEDKSRRPVAFFIGSRDGRSRTNIIAFP